MVPAGPAEEFDAGGAEDRGTLLGAALRWAGQLATRVAGGGTEAAGEL